MTFHLTPTLVVVRPFDLDCELHHSCQMSGFGFESETGQSEMQQY